MKKYENGVTRDSTPEEIAEAQQNGGGISDTYELLQEVNITEPTYRAITWSTNGKGYDDFLFVASGATNTATTLGIDFKFESESNRVYANIPNVLSETTEKNITVEFNRYLNNRIRREMRQPTQSIQEIVSDGLPNGLSYDSKIINFVIRSSSSSSNSFLSGNYKLYGKRKF